MLMFCLCQKKITSVATVYNDCTSKLTFLTFSHNNYCDWIYKTVQMPQELKSNLKPNINHTLVHSPEVSTTWL